MPASAIAVAKVAGSPFRRSSTDGIKLSERREFWQSLTSSVCGSHEVEILGSEPFSAGFEHAEISNLIFSRLSHNTPHRVLRTNLLARRDHRHFVKAVRLASGRCVIEQSGRTTCLRAGEWSIYDNARPYRMTILGRVEMSLLLIPRDRFVDRNFDLQDLAVRRLPGRRGLGKLIWNLVSNTFEQIPQILDATSHDVAEIIVQMVRLALTDICHERGAVDSKAALRERVKLYIASHLGDPELSLAKLASSTGCTKRYLHMAFRPEQISISDYILKQRVERCREDLLNPAFAHKSITEIAFSWGFNNSNHFSRCFKQAFGLSPRGSRSEFAPWLAHRPESHLRLR
jgi:AraC-like DNA-binding protein